MGSRAQKRAPLNQAYVASVYEACRTIQGCSDVLTGGLLAIQRQASAAPDRPQVDVRASFVDAVKYFSAQHGPTDSVFVDKEEHFHRREGLHRYNDSASTIPSFTPEEAAEAPEVSRERCSSDAPLVKPLASLALNNTASPITPRSQALSDQAQAANENSPSVYKSTSNRPPMLRISPSKSGLSPSEDLAFAKAHSSTTANAARCSSFGSPATPCSRMRPPHAASQQSPISPSSLSLPTPSNRAYGSPGTPEYSKAAYKEHDARPPTPQPCALFEPQDGSTRPSSRPASADIAPASPLASKPRPRPSTAAAVSDTHMQAAPSSPGGKITRMSTRRYKLSPRQAACDREQRERRGLRSPSPHPLGSPHRTAMSPTRFNAGTLAPQSPTIKADNSKLRNTSAARPNSAGKGHLRDDGGSSKADPTSCRPPPSPLGNSERRPLEAHSRVYGNNSSLAAVSKQSECRSRKQIPLPVPHQPAAHAPCEAKVEVQPAKEHPSARMVRRSVLSWGRASQAVKQSVSATPAVEDAFHLKTASPLAESASRMSTGGSADAGSQSARQ